MKGHLFCEAANFLQDGGLPREGAWCNCIHHKYFIYCIVGETGIKEAGECEERPREKN